MLEDLIKTVCEETGWEKELIAAFIQIESGGNSYRVRYESKWVWQCKPYKFSGLNDISLETEAMLQKCSWGLMQVMGAVARELGLVSDLPRLTDPEVGLRYGIAQLERLKIKYQGDDLIAAYNAGAPFKNSDGKYHNQNYVDEVKHWYNTYKMKGIDLKGNSP